MQTELPARPAGREPLRQGLRVRAQPRHHSEGQRRLRAGRRGRRNNRDHILRAHRNFLRDAVYFLYEHNRMADAAQWFRYLGTKYPDKTLIDGKPDSLPAQPDPGSVCLSRIQEDISETSRDRVQSAIEGLLTSLHEPGRGRGRSRRRVQIAGDQDPGHLPQQDSRGPHAAIGLPSVEENERVVLNRVLDPENGFPPEARAILRTRLGLPAETAPAPVPALGASTNTPPASVTNAPAPASR